MERERSGVYRNRLERESAILPLPLRSNALLVTSIADVTCYCSLRTLYININFLDFYLF